MLRHEKLAQKLICVYSNCVRGGRFNNRVLKTGHERQRTASNQIHGQQTWWSGYNPGKQHDVEKQSREKNMRRNVSTNQKIQQIKFVAQKCVGGLIGSNIYFDIQSLFSAAVSFSFVVALFLNGKYAHWHICQWNDVFRLSIIIHHKSGSLTVATGYLFVVCNNMRPMWIPEWFAIKCGIIPTVRGIKWTHDNKEHAWAPEPRFCHWMGWAALLGLCIRLPFVLTDCYDISFCGKTSIPELPKWNRFRVTGWWLENDGLWCETWKLPPDSERIKLQR